MNIQPFLNKTKTFLFAFNSKTWENKKPFHRSQFNWMFAASFSSCFAFQFHHSAEMANICFLLILVVLAEAGAAWPRRGPSHHIHNQQFFNILSPWIIHADVASPFAVLRFQIIQFRFRFFPCDPASERCSAGTMKKGFLWLRSTTKGKSGNWICRCNLCNSPLLLRRSSKVR